MSTQVSFAIDDELYAKMQRLALDMERPVEELLGFAVEDFFAEERENADAFLAAEADFAAGRVVSHEEVGEWIQSLSTDHPLPNPGEKFNRKLAS